MEFEKGRKLARRCARDCCTWKVEQGSCVENLKFSTDAGQPVVVLSKQTIDSRSRFRQCLDALSPGLPEFDLCSWLPCIATFFSS